MPNLRELIKKSLNERSSLESMGEDFFRKYGGEELQQLEAIVKRIKYDGNLERSPSLVNRLRTKFKKGVMAELGLKKLIPGSQNRQSSRDPLARYSDYFSADSGKPLVITVGHDIDPAQAHFYVRVEELAEMPNEEDIQSFQSGWMNPIFSKKVSDYEISYKYRGMDRSPAHIGYLKRFGVNLSPED